LYFTRSAHIHLPCKLEEQLRVELEHSGNLSQALQEREERSDSLEQERRHALETVSHLEQRLHQNDAELAECSQRLFEREAELEATRKELRALRLERSKPVETQTQDELEHLRRQVHELQKESADKEVRIAQLSKQRMQDREDLEGLNLALDSKQQELELVSSDHVNTDAH
jgi:predicted nuclease with TOPRIM domain